jgi:ribosomal protein L37E
MKLKCIAPDEITEEQIIAYIDGEADSATRAHIRRCPCCAKRAHEYDLDQQALRALLYRVDCPDAHTLGEYYLGLGLLSPADRAVIEEHVRDCSLCLADIAKLERFLEEENVETITPQLIAAIVAGEMYLSEEPRWVSPSGKEQARAVFQGLNLLNLNKEKIVMKCPKCGKPVHHQWMYCVHCGHQLRNPRRRTPHQKKPSALMYCPQCEQGRTWLRGWPLREKIVPKFCYKCGTELVRQSE